MTELTDLLFSFEAEHIFAQSLYNDSQNRLPVDRPGDLPWREIDCGPYDMNPGLLAERVLSIARFMASSGPVFADGHSFSFGRPEVVDALLEDRFSPLGGVHRPVFGLRLIAQERKAA